MKSLSLSALAAALLVSGVAAAAPNEISIPGDHTFPESITGTSDGTLYIGSLGDGGVFRVPPGGSAAVPFIAKGIVSLILWRMLAGCARHGRSALTMRTVFKELGGRAAHNQSAVRHAHSL